jgi:metal-responsive CopG/Arc/MetJ family transcriptional regulator
MERINITLSGQTLQMIDRVAKKGDRSSFIDAAVHFYIDKIGQRQLRKLLREGAEKHVSRDLQITQDWFSLENEA